MGPRSFDLYESKAGHFVASAVSETLKMSADDEAFQVQFLGVDSNRLPFLADDGKERQHIRQRPKWERSGKAREMRLFEPSADDFP